MGGTTHMLRPSPNLLLYYFRLGGLLSRFLLHFISIHQYYVITKLLVDQNLTVDFKLHPAPTCKHADMVWMCIGMDMHIFLDIS